MRFVPLIVAAALLLAGCGDMLDINQKALVVGAGIDVAPPPDAYTVSVQFQAPAGGSQGGGGVMGGGGSGGSNSECATISGSGVDVAEAVSQARGKTDAYIYFGNLSVIVIGNRLARQGVLNPLDYFRRHGEISESAQLLVSQGVPSSLFQGSCPANGVAFSLFQYLSLAEHTSMPVADNPLWRFLMAEYSASHASYLPVFAPSSDSGTLFDDLGDAIFVNGRMVGELLGYPGTVFDFLVKHGGFPYALVTVPGVTTPAALQFRSVERHITVQGPEEGTVTMTFTGFFREAPGVRIDDHDIRALEAVVSRQLQGQIRMDLAKLQSWGADVLDFSDYVHARYPQAVTHWPERFRRMRIRLDVEVRIRTGGRGS